MKKLIKKYESKGYHKLVEFPKEYVLMYRYHDGAKIRIYENGNVFDYGIK